MLRRPLTAPSALVLLASLVAAGPGGPGRACAQDALALSGGGARGLAHVGALLHLDSLGYDPPLVVGNSMGAVIGALYAAGYAPDRIRDLTLGIAWGELFDPTATLLGPDRQARLPMLSVNLGPRGGEIGRGLLGEWRVNRMLARILFDAGARARGDFDRLPRRYRAIAADLATGEKVVLARGDLALAARASMAYPGFWSPVRWGDRILVDGGIADNLPTSEARALGAARIVAVDVSRPEPEVASLDPVSVAQRSLDLMQQGLHPDPEDADVLIAPATAEYLTGPGFPADPRPLIELGRVAAREAMPVVTPAGAGGARSPAPPPAALGALRIETRDAALAAFARDVFAPLAPGPYDPEAVLAAVDRLYGTGLFEGIWPRVVGPERDGEAPVLAVRLDAPPRFALSGAAGYDTDRGGRAWVSMDRYTPVAGRPTTLAAAASGNGVDRWAALSARIHALGRPIMAWSLGAHVREARVPVPADDVRVTSDVLRAGGWIAIELPHLLRERTLTLSGVGEWLDPESATGGPSYGPLLRLADLPTPARVVGLPFLLEAEARWGDAPYRRVAVAASAIVRRGPLRIAPLADVRVATSRAPLDVRPALGDDRAVPGLRWGDVRGRARVVAGLDLALPAPLGGFARLRVRSGAAAARPSDWQAARWVTGAELGGVWSTPLGLLEVGYGHATVDDGRFELAVGRQF